MYRKISLTFSLIILLFATYSINVHAATTVDFSQQAPSTTKVADTFCAEFTNYSCNNGPAPGNSGGCGTACDGGNAWERHEYSGCYKDPDSPGDYKAWVPYTEDVCSTADKYNDRYGDNNLTVLRFGFCSCQTGNIYKTCCNGTTPVNTYNYTVATGQGNPDFPDGACAFTTVQCGGAGQPPCGAPACAPLATPTPAKKYGCFGPNSSCVESTSGIYTTSNCNNECPIKCNCPKSGQWTGECCNEGDPIKYESCPSDSSKFTVALCNYNPDVKRYCRQNNTAPNFCYSDPTICQQYGVCTVPGSGAGTCTDEQGRKYPAGSTRTNCQPANVCSL